MKKSMISLGAVLILVFSVFLTGCETITETTGTSSTITTSEITTTDTGEDHSDDNFPQGQHRPWASDNHSFPMEPRSGNITREFPDGFLEQWGSDNTTGVFPRDPGGQGFPDDEVHQMPVPGGPWSSDNGTSPKPPFSDDMNDENASILPNEET